MYIAVYTCEGILRSASVCPCAQDFLLVDAAGLAVSCIAHDLQEGAEITAWYLQKNKGSGKKKTVLRAFNSAYLLRMATEKKKVVVALEIDL